MPGITMLGAKVLIKDGQFPPLSCKQYK